LILIVYARWRVMYSQRRASHLGAGGEVWTASAWRRRAIRCGRDATDIDATGSVATGTAATRTVGIV